MFEKNRNLDSLFEAAIAIDSAEKRAAFLDQHCGDDQSLRGQLEKLLAADEQAGSFLEKPPVELGVTIAAPDLDEQRAASLEAGLASAFGPEEAVVVGNRDHSVLQSLGQTVDIPRVSLREAQGEIENRIEQPRSPEVPSSSATGRYRVDGEIARGGMGAILKGRDTDLGRDLAIKVLLDEHKTRPEVIQRFIEEAQIGGQLQHPGIAPVYELGQFADQRPFFSMKLVKGQTLAKLLAERRELSQDRTRFLGIFEQICQTIGYAHARGVIHRDLKPANIMVGAFGEVQVMDWGLAKVLLSGGVADERTANRKHKDEDDVTVLKTLRSVGSDLPGSAGSGMGGEGPGSNETQMGSVMGTPAYMPPEQALGEIDQLNQRSDVFGLGAILCEILTGKPPYVGDDSTAVYRLATRGDLAGAHQRLDACGADPVLVALTKRCLASRPTDRPADGKALAEEISGYLESVEAKLRQSEVERAREAARVIEQQKRMRQAVALAATILLTLGLGIAGTTWGLFEARSQTELAKRETREKTLALEEKQQALDEKEVALQAEIAAKEEAKQLSEFLANVFKSPDPYRDGSEIKVVELLDTAAEKLETDLAEQPKQRANMQAALGSTYWSLGLYKQAVPLLEQVYEYSLETLGSEDPKTLSAMTQLGNGYFMLGRGADALPVRERVYEIRRRVDGSDHPDTLAAMNNLALSYMGLNRESEALAMQEECLEAMRRVNGTDHANTLNAIKNLSVSYGRAGRLEEALKLNEEEREITTHLFGPDHPRMVGIMLNAGAIHSQLGDLEKTIEIQEKCLDLVQRVLPSDQLITSQAMMNLANSYTASGRLSEAIALHEKALAIARRTLAPTHDQLRLCYESLFSAYLHAERYNDAIEYGEFLRDETGASGPEDRMTLGLMTDLADAYSKVGRIEEAIQLQQETLSMKRRLLTVQDRFLMKAFGQLVSMYIKAGRNTEAQELVRDWLSLLPETPDGIELGPLSNAAANCVNVGVYDEAIKIGEFVVSYWKTSRPEERVTLGAMTNLAYAYFLAGRNDEAIQLQEEALSIKRRVLPSNDPFLRAALGNLVRVHISAGNEAEAQQAIDEWLSLVSEQADGLTQLSYTLSAGVDPEGNYPFAETALEVARKACELKPKHSGAEAALGLALYRTEQWQEAIDALLRADEYEEENDKPSAWRCLYLAMAHWQLGDQEQARAWYDKAAANKQVNDPLLSDAFQEADELMGQPAEPHLPPEEKQSVEESQPKRNAGDETGND